MPATLHTSKKRPLKPFDIEPPKAIPKKHFASEEENNCG